MRLPPRLQMIPVSLKSVLVYQKRAGETRPFFRDATAVAHLASTTTRRRPKSETRTPKPEGNPKAEIRKGPRAARAFSALRPSRSHGQAGRGQGSRCSGEEQRIGQTSSQAPRMGSEFGVRFSAFLRFSVFGFRIWGTRAWWYCQDAPCDRRIANRQWQMAKAESWLGPVGCAIGLYHHVQERS
jgi:hypothetical protein